MQEKTLTEQLFTTGVIVKSSAFDAELERMATKFATTPKIELELELMFDPKQ